MKDHGRYTTNINQQYDIWIYLELSNDGVYPSILATSCGFHEIPSLGCCPIDQPKWEIMAMENQIINRLYPLVMTNIAMENPNHKCHLFLWAMASMAHC